MNSLITVNIKLAGLKSFITRILEFIITAAFAVIILLTISLVILRYGFNSSIIIGNELMEYLFIYTTAFGAAVSLSRHDHIKIDFFILKLHGVIRMVIDILGQLMIAGINLVIMYLSFPWIHVVGSSESPVMRIPMSFIQIAIPIGCGLAALYALMNVITIYTEATPPPASHASGRRGKSE